MDTTKVVFETETSDPDDFMTLLWFADHPRVELIGVVVTPGTRDQVRLVRWGLAQCGRSDVPVGVYNLEHPKDCVSAWHYDVFGDEPRSGPAEAGDGARLIAELFAANPEATLVTGAPPKSSGKAHREHPELRIARWVCQGGFAGDSVVPEVDRLAKFAGRETCATFNLGGAHKQALELIASPRIERRLFVSKNVCHGVAWDRALSDALAGRTAERRGHALIRRGMDAYLREHPEGKIIHDLVAAAVAVNEAVCTFTEVELYRERGEWGSRPTSGTRTWISVRYDRAALIDTLAE